MSKEGLKNITLKEAKKKFGEESWIKYSNSFNEFWTNTDFQLKLLQKCNGRLDIAKVIFFHLREDSLKWMNSSIPALGNLTPLKCLKDENLRNKLKTCLFRFPV